MTLRTESEERFEEIYRECKKDIYQICMSYLKNEHLANDIMHQTFVKVYERYRHDKPEKLKAYLSLAAKNLSLNYIRDSKHEVQSDAIEICAMQREELVPSPEDSMIREENRRKTIAFGANIFRELEEKNQNWYAILYMMFVLEMDHDEIAEKLGISKEVLYARLHRAKVWISKKYGDELEDIIS